MVFLYRIDSPWYRPEDSRNSYIRKGFLGPIALDRFGSSIYCVIIIEVSLYCNNALSPWSEDRRTLWSSPVGYRAWYVRKDSASGKVATKVLLILLLPDFFILVLSVLISSSSPWVPASSSFLSRAPPPVPVSRKSFYSIMRTVGMGLSLVWSIRSLVLK